MNRKQRREAKRDAPKKKPIFHNMTRQERIERICKNGITLDDLKRNYDDGFNAGYKLAGEDAVKACYAALCLALHELHGFGQKRCKDVLKAVDDAILYRLTGDDLIQDVFDKIGLTINFSDPMERIKEDIVQ